MKYLVFSDLHGNLPALEKVLKNEKNIDGYINLGDVVNYGPWSNECVELIDNLDNCINIRGNHEDYFISGICNVKNKIVKAFFDINYSFFNKKDKIKKYLRSSKFMDFEIKHNLMDKGYIYDDTKIKLSKNTIIGHSHQQYERLINGLRLVNPGSIGQNRLAINISNYAIWDLNKNQFIFKQLDFDINIVIQKMKSINFPEICINYYKKKINEI